MFMFLSVLWRWMIGGGICVYECVQMCVCVFCQKVGGYMRPSVFVGQVAGYKRTGTGEITIDSAAEESVCPEDWEKQFGTRPVGPGGEMKFRTASGGKMRHYGSRLASFTAKDGQEDRMMGLEFQVSDVRKPLAAVWRIAEKGNIVQFGPTDADCFIQNIRSKEKVGLRRKGGSYVMAVDFAEKEGGEVFQRRA